MHGIQHYEATNSDIFGKLSEIKDNDLYKLNLARSNGVKEYIEINCSESDEFNILNNILNSKIGYLFENVDINSIIVDSQKSIYIMALELWNEGLSVIEISKELKLDRNSLSLKLRLFDELGLCKYDQFRSIRRN